MHKAASSHSLSEWFRKEFTQNCLRSPIRSSFQSVSMSFQSPVRQSQDADRSSSRLRQSSIPNEEFVIGCSVCGSKAISEITEDTLVDTKNSGSYVKLLEKRIRPASSDLQLGKQARRTSPVYNDMVSLRPFKLVKEHADPDEKLVSTVRYNEVQMSPRPQLTPLNYEDYKLVKESMFFNPAANQYVREEERKRVVARRNQYANRGKGTSTQFLMNSFCEQTNFNPGFYEHRSNLSVKQNILANKSFSVTSPYQPPEKRTIDYQNSIDQHIPFDQQSGRSSRMNNTSRRAQADRQASSNQLSTRMKDSARRTPTESYTIGQPMSSKGIPNKSSRMKLASNKPPEESNLRKQHLSTNELYDTPSRRPPGESYSIEHQLSSHELYGTSSRMPSGEIYSIEQPLSSNELCGKSGELKDWSRNDTGESYSFNQYTFSNKHSGKDRMVPTDLFTEEMEDTCTFNIEGSIEKSKKPNAKKEPKSGIKSKNSPKKAWQGTSNCQSPLGTNAKNSPRNHKSTVGSAYRTPHGTNAKNTPRANSKIKESATASRLDEIIKKEKTQETPRSNKKIEKFRPPKLNISQMSPRSGRDLNLLSPLTAQSRQSAKSPTSSKLGLSSRRVHQEEIEIQQSRSRDGAHEANQANENRHRDRLCAHVDDKVIKGLRLLGGFADYLERGGLSLITRRH